MERNVSVTTEMPEFKPGDLVWFEPGIGFPLPGEVQEVHRAAQIIIVVATVDGKVNKSEFHHVKMKISTN